MICQMVHSCVCVPLIITRLVSGTTNGQQVDHWYNHMTFGNSLLHTCSIISYCLYPGYATIKSFTISVNTWLLTSMCSTISSRCVSNCKTIISSTPMCYTKLHSMKSTSRYKLFVILTINDVTFLGYEATWCHMLQLVYMTLNTMNIVVWC